jgi:hypothetical protein
MCKAGGLTECKNTTSVLKRFKKTIFLFHAFCSEYSVELYYLLRMERKGGTKRERKIGSFIPSVHLKG